MLTPLIVSVSTTGVLTVTVPGVTTSVPVFVPAATVMYAGFGVITAELLVTGIISPPAGAGVFRVIVNVEDCLPFTDAGDAENCVTAGAFTSIDAVFTVAPRVAVMLIFVSVVTAVGVIERVAVLAPAGTVSVVPGGMVVPSELDRIMGIPEGPAMLVRVTVTVLAVPPYTIVGAVKAFNCAASTVTATGLLTVPSVPIMVTAVSASTICVVVRSEPFVAPPAIAIVPPGTAGELPVTRTFKPPAGAGEER